MEKHTIVIEKTATGYSGYFVETRRWVKVMQWMFRIPSNFIGSTGKDIPELLVNLSETWVLNNEEED